MGSVRSSGSVGTSLDKLRNQKVINRMASAYSKEIGEISGNQESDKLAANKSKPGQAKKICEKIDPICGNQNLKPYFRKKDSFYVS